MFCLLRTYVFGMILVEVLRKESHAMLRLDFHTMITIIMQHLKAADITQVDLLYYIFEAFIEDEHTDFVFDNGQVCHWINGRQRISPKIVSFYVIPEHQELMKGNFINKLFPIISDLGKLASDTKNLLIQDCSISDYEKNRLLGLYNDVDDIAIAEFFCFCFLFGISRAFIKATKNSRFASPDIHNVILSTDVPKPIKDFISRDDDISAVSALLQQHKTLFITGLPGIGKSELAKQYAKEHKKDYTNILYMEYTGSFYEMIADLDFIDDTDSLSEKDRFRKHYRFLKTLQEDSLLIIDNFYTLEAEDSLLQQICSLKCTVLLTSCRCNDTYAHYNLKPSDTVAHTLLRHTLTNTSPAFGGSYKDELNVILETICYNLVATELVGRLLAYQIMTPDALKHDLKENILLPAETSALTLTKDNHRLKDAFQAHMLQLLGYNDLPKKEQQLLSYIALAPETGFPLKLLHKWCNNYTDQLDSLIYKGIVSVGCDVVSIKPYIRKLTNAGKFLTTRDCEPLFLNIKEILSTDNSEVIRFSLYIVDMIDRFVMYEPSTLWISIVRASLEFNNRYHRYRSFSRLLGTYEYLCIKSDFESSSDRYLLEHFKAIEAWNIHKNINKAIEFEEKAIFLAGKDGSDIPQFSTLYLDAGRYYHVQGKTAKALEYIQKAYSLLEHAKMQYSPNGISCLIQYARLLFDQRNFSEALRIYTNCLGLIKNVYGTDSLMAGYITQNLAALYHILRNVKSASLMYAQAETILAKHLGGEHEDVLQCHERAHSLNTADKISLMNVPEMAEKIIA